MRKIKLGKLLILQGCIAISPVLVPGTPILPFHIISAIECYAFFILCVAGCIGISCSKKWPPLVPISACETGLLFAAFTMISGAVWAKAAWGTFWTWDPRLSGMLLMTLFFVSWRLAISILGHQSVSNPKLTASLIVLGLPAMAFTHLAVNLFGGIHPASVEQLIYPHGEIWQYLTFAIGQTSLGCGIVLIRNANAELQSE